MSAVIHRLAVELHSRGLAGFIQFIASRLVQLRGDVLYEYDLTDFLALEKFPSKDVIVIDRTNFGSSSTRAIEANVLMGDNYLYVNELEKDGALLAVANADGTVASYAFIIFASFYKRVLGEDDTVPIICNCVTFLPYRGQGLYPLLLQEACRYLAMQGYERAIVTCAPDNMASMRGIEKAGFHKVKTLRSLILFTRWIARQHETKT